jgi:hypothetical protein
MPVVMVRKWLPASWPTLLAKCTPVWMPLGDLDFGVGYENHTSYPAPGQMILYPGGITLEQGHAAEVVDVLDARGDGEEVVAGELADLAGEGVWMPLGDLDFGVGYENHTSYPAPGQMILYPGGIRLEADRLGALEQGHAAEVVDVLDARGDGEEVVAGELADLALERRGCVDAPRRPRFRRRLREPHQLPGARPDDPLSRRHQRDRDPRSR